jgi:hypothetical protein
LHVTLHDHRQMLRNYLHPPNKEIQP